MGRSYKTKTYGANIDENAMNSAISDVLEREFLIRKSEKKYNIQACTLKQRIERKKNKKTKSATLLSKYCSQQGFNDEQGKQINQYVVKCSKMKYG